MNSAADQPRALLIRTAGTNCDAELAHAFTLAGAGVQTIHLDTLIAQPELLRDFQLIGFPGGFSYGDDIAAGRIFAMKVRRHLFRPLAEAVERGTPIIGICNGFQILVQVGLLPGPAAGEAWPAEAPTPIVTLADNEGGRFIDNWCPVTLEANSACIWTKDVDVADPARLLPIAHGEGRFIPADDATLARIEQAGCVALRYRGNPNGSVHDIAGICDASGLILGLMPHPERYVHPTQHPSWTRLAATDPAFLESETLGLRLIRRAVNYAAARPASSCSA
ncbi:MAG: phosphoribosylformylglycinamidine synthase subunit PurQ [Phycisphaerales bacterium JB038]